MKIDNRYYITYCVISEYASCFIPRGTRFHECALTSIKFFCVESYTDRGNFNTKKVW